MNHHIAILNEDPEWEEKSFLLASQLSLPIIQSIIEHYRYVLVYTKEHLELRQVASRLKPIYIDFLSTALHYRRKYGGGRRELIARAVGIKGKNLPSVIDATAGLGQDAMILASLGCEILMLERSPIIGALLQDALFHAQEDDFFKQLDVRLIITDANEFLPKLIIEENKKPDVIYLDPMFPMREKSALVKKEMRILKEIVGHDLDTTRLFNTALQCALHRVVVKRPRLAPAIVNDIKPNIIYRGKSCRFDVYLVK